MAQGSKTSIEVYKKTRDLLKGIGSKGESYDDIIVRLIKERVDRVVG